MVPMDPLPTSVRPVRRPKQERGRATRTAILRAAEALFDRRGYDDVTTTDIAREARVSVGSLYAYFPDKSEILCEVLQWHAAEVAGAIGPTLDPRNWGKGADRSLIRRA